MLNFLSISGSLRAHSMNTAVLEALSLIAPPGVRVSRYVGLPSLPPFNPDFEETELPKTVRELRNVIKHSDALIISSPEYARGVAGSLKNLLDWLVADLDFAGKPVALINTSPRSEHAPAQLRLILSTMSAHILDATCITLPLLGQKLSPQEIRDNNDLADQLRELLGALAREVSAPKICNEF